MRAFVLGIVTTLLIAVYLLTLSWFVPPPPQFSSQTAPVKTDQNVPPNAITSSIIWQSTTSNSGMAPCSSISDCAYDLLNQRVTANRDNFYVFKDSDSAFNHGFPSGLFGTIDLTKVKLDSGCLDDPASSTGCSTDPTRLDTTHGTVFRFNYPTLAGSEFVGLNWEEPEHYSGQPSSSNGYDVTPATSVHFDARSPDNAKVQFGVGGCVTRFYELGPGWSRLNFSFADLIPPPGPSNISCPTDLTNTHVLFTARRSLFLCHRKSGRQQKPELRHTRRGRAACTQFQLHAS